MMWFFAILVVLVMGGVAALAAGRGTPMSPAYDDRPDALVPRTGPLGADDVRKVRFSLAVRGYRMSEVDALLDRVARQLEDAEAPPAPVGSEPPADAEAPPARVGSEPPADADTAGQGEVADTPAVREARGDDPVT